MDDGSEKPIAFASLNLSPAEKNCSHLEKESLTLIFGVKNFYCYGRHLEPRSDHKPHIGILAEGKKIPKMTAARLQ